MNRAILSSSGPATLSVVRLNSITHPSRRGDDVCAVDSPWLKNRYTRTSGGRFSNRYNQVEMNTLGRSILF